MTSIRNLLLAAASVAAFLALAGPASANTFCVPTYSDACPATGINEAEPDLNAALLAYGSDGNPDKVIIAPGTLTATESFVAVGTDPLEVTGAGRDKTFLTSSSSGNIFVLRTDDRPGTVMSDLTVVVPASFPDAGGNGSAMQIENADLTRVDVEVRNSESSAFSSMIGNNVIRDSHVYAAEGSKVDYGFRSNVSSPGKTRIIGSRIDDSNYALVANKPGTVIEASSSRVIDPEFLGVWAGGGGRVNLENTLIQTSGGTAISAVPEAGKPNPTIVTVVSSTLVNVGTPGDPAIEIDIPNSVTAGGAVVGVGSSIISGYDATWNLDLPIGPGFPSATLSFNYSNFPPVAAEGSGGTVDFGSPTNINQDPGFVSPQDFHLTPGSPSIDAGDPASMLTTDIDGSPRPRDGDGNRTSLIDQGAFEYQPTCATAPALCPTVSKLKFKFRRGKGGSLRFLLSLAAKVRVRFTPVPKHRKPKRKTVKITRKFKAGQAKIKLGKYRLKPGRYKLRITAYDKTGHSARPLTKKVSVR